MNSSVNYRHLMWDLANAVGYTFSITFTGGYSVWEFGPIKWTQNYTDEEMYLSILTHILKDYNELQKNKQA